MFSSHVRAASAALALVVVVACHHLMPAQSFAAISPTARSRSVLPAARHPATATTTTSERATVTLFAAEEDTGDAGPSLSDSESFLLGKAGLIASAIVIYSESVLFRTGCGLPAGPYGLYGAAEGVSYLGVVGLVGYSLYTKIKTGNGLPSGMGNLLGAAEGTAYLAALAGILVLFAQVTNYGYIPNFVPMEGGMCQ